MAVDPGFTKSKTSCYTGVCIGTLAPTNTIYVIYADQFRETWDDARERVLQLAKGFRVDTLYIEGGAQQSALLSYFREHGIRRVESVSTSGLSKKVRAHDVSGEVNAGRVVLPGLATWAVKSGAKLWTVQPTHRARYDKLAKKVTGQPYGDIEELVQQMRAYPGLEHNDLIDAFVYCIQQLRERMAPASEQPAPLRTDMVTRWQAMESRIFGAEPKPNENEEWLVLAGEDHWQN